MVTKKSKKQTTRKSGRVKVGKLKVNKETLKDLSGKDLKKVKGGVGCYRTQPLI